MENTLLAANDKGRIYKTEDGKFWCEEISRCALCGLEEEVGMFFGDEPEPPETLALFKAAGFADDLPERTAIYENKKEWRWRAESLRAEMEKLEEKLRRAEKNAA